MAMVTRRTFLVGVGQGAFALAVASLAGCSPAADRATPAGDGSAVPPSVGPSTSTGPVGSPTSDPVGTDGVAWERVDLGIVSAYVLVRGGEAAVVDTGVAGSEHDIAAALDRLGLDWSAVGHVIVTHKHADHAGSLRAILAAAPEATAYAGAGDIAAISAGRAITAVEDGATVFDLQVVATPGHTPGHISVHDPINGILVAGDALNTANGAVTGPNPAYTDDMATATASVAKLGTLDFETLLVGHGDPITAGASQMVAALAVGG